MVTDQFQTTEYPLKVGRCLSPEGHAWRHPFPEFVECTRCHASILVDNRHDHQGATIVMTSPVQDPSPPMPTETTVLLTREQRILNALLELVEAFAGDDTQDDVRAMIQECSQERADAE